MSDVTPAALTFYHTQGQEHHGALVRAHDRIRELEAERLDEDAMLEAVACAVGDAFPESRQLQRSGAATAALARYRRTLSRRGG